MLPVPRSWSELTPAWMTSAIAERCPGALVDAVDVGSVAAGTNTRAIVRLSYRVGAGPASVFAKANGRVLNRLALLALGAWAAEARLADSGLALPLEHPGWYAAGVDRSRLAAIVVMDDVTGCCGRPNRATVPLDVADVRSGLEGLARLHAAYWNRPPVERFLRPWRLGTAWAAVSGVSLVRGMGNYASARRAGQAAIAVGARSLEQQFRRSAQLAATGVQTLLHGDPHPGNTYWSPGGRTGFYDWQLVRTGNWSHDVGYFLVSSLAVADRREREKELLGGYIDALGRAGVACGPRFDEAWERYRATPAFGLASWLHALSFGGFQPDDVCRAVLERFAAAYEDLGTYRSLVAGEA